MSSGRWSGRSMPAPARVGDPSGVTDRVREGLPAPGAPASASWLVGSTNRVVSPSGDGGDGQPAPASRQAFRVLVGVWRLG
jgi:hypothetical protein